MNDRIELPPTPEGTRLVWIVMNESGGVPGAFPRPFALLDVQGRVVRGYRYWSDNTFSQPGSLSSLEVGDHWRFDTLEEATDFYAGFFENRARNCRENSAMWVLPDTAPESEREEAG